MKTVTKQTPCPICGKPDWCGLSDDEAISICMREPKGCIGIAKNGGYIHILKERNSSELKTRTRTIRIEPPKIKDDFEYRRLNGLLRNAMTDERIGVLSKQLGLSADSLHRLQVGWCNCLNVWSFPMFDPDGHITGFRLRTPEGFKLSLKGGREGLFIPRNLKLDHRSIFICEGPTDTAAMLDIGFDAIGRPSCLGAVKMTVEYIKKNNPWCVVIFADGDKPGQNGARSLANALIGIIKHVYIITPPDGVKDIRQWKNSGATYDDVRKLINTTQPINFEIHGAIA